MEYGILAKRAEVLQAIRLRHKLRHAQILAHRILNSTALPAELIDMIADEIVELDRKDIIRLWKASSEAQKTYRFGLDYETEAMAIGSPVATELASIRFRIMPAGVPTAVTPMTADDYRYLVIHTREPNQLTAHRAGKVPDTINAQYHPYGSRRATNHMILDGKTFYEVDGPASVDFDWSKSQRRFVLLDTDEAEETVKAWDQDVVDKFLQVFKVKPVKTVGQGGSVSAPVLHIW